MINSKNKKIFAKLFFSFFLLCVFIPVYSEAQAREGGIDSLIREAENRRIAIARTMEDSTVFIFYDAGDEVSLGTGFVVGNGYVLTNGHVVDGGSNFFIAGKKFAPVRARLIKMIDNNVDDFAVLQFSPPVQLPILSFNLNLNRTDRVSAWGFPYAYTKFDKNTDALLHGQSRVVPPVITTEGIVNAFITAENSMASILHSANIAKGNSGGPLVNSRGHVVGVNTWVSAEEGEGSHVNAALTARAAIAFLRSAGVEPQIVGGEPQISGDEPQVAEHKPLRFPFLSVGPSSAPNNSDDNQRSGTNNSDSAPSGNDLTGDAKDLYSEAVKGTPEAQAYIAVAYWEGELAPKNMQKALYWFKQAVSNDDNNAKALLGFIYLTEPDYLNVKEGMRLLEQSANKDPEYASAVALFSYRGEMLGIDRDLEKTLQAAKRGTEVEDPEAMALLALLYHMGDGVEADSKYAFELAQKAAESDIALAYAVLSWIYNEGEVVEKDLKKSIEYAEKAAEEDESLGKALLALYYYDGDGVKQDYKKSFHYANEAAEAFDEVGQFILGLLYANGEGVDEDLIKAWAYFDMAARKDIGDAPENRNIVGENLSKDEINDAKELVKQWYLQYGLTFNEKY